MRGGNGELSNCNDIVGQRLNRIGCEDVTEILNAQRSKTALGKVEAEAFGINGVDEFLNVYQVLVEGSREN